MLSTATELPVFAANDANAGAIAEHIFGSHQNADHMIFVNGGASGIGAGFVVAGELLDGATGYAGELGHTYVGGNATCHCGRIGCLETEVSESTTKTVERQARYLGIALGNAINMLNPGLIVLGGFLRVFPEIAAEVLSASVARHSLRAPRNLVRVVPASLGSETLMIGAAELAFAALLADPAAHYHQTVDRDDAVRRGDDGIGLDGIDTSPSSVAISREGHDHIRQRVDVDRWRTAPAGQQRTNAQTVEQAQRAGVRHRRAGHHPVGEQLHQRAARGDDQQRAEGVVAHEADRDLDAVVDHRLDGHRPARVTRAIAV